MNFLDNLLCMAKQKKKTIVFPEASFSDRIIKAVLYLKKHNICEPLLIGDETSIVVQCKKLIKCKIVNPKTSNLKEELANELFNARKDKGMTESEANSLILDPFYFATMLVKCGYADGMVGGAEVSTAQNLKPALQLLREENSFANTYMLMVGKNKYTTNPFVLTDCALVENPTEEQLSVIAKRVCNEFVSLTNYEPKVAFLSYSSNGSAKSDSITKMKNATELFASENKTKCVGEVQFDAAMCPCVAKTKLNSDAQFFGGANVLVFPELNSANICYKAISYFGNLYAIGPITVGLKKPVNDLSRGATVKDIIYVTAITVLQCKD